MASEYSNLLTDIEQCTQQAVAEGWLDQTVVSNLLIEDTVSAKELFVSANERPLVVAFMGGTGVGKSSLLNKLAGKAIAKAGVERPTSHEVTLFHHQSINLSQLDEKFPLQQIQIAQHNEAAGEKVIWIDMPDFDSTEEKNKDIVMQWLPYIDVLVYVVSPERYRDNKAWQLLLSQGASYAWLFVMNQWDRGETVQYDDFKQQLAKAGFNNPLIYKTACTEYADDELPSLQAAIEALADKNTVEQLELRGAQQRKNNLKQNLKQCLQALGDERSFSTLLENQTENWAETQLTLKQGFDWPIKQAASGFSKMDVKPKQIQLWDEWAQTRLNDYLDDLILNADQQSLPVDPLRTGLLEIREKSEKIIHTQTELACRQALVNPGNLIQRVTLKVAYICEFILPLITMCVVGFHVLQGYYESAMTGEAFLGVNFMVHSLLLILLSWLLPYFLTKKIQPSLEKTALKGLNKGLNMAMDMVDLEIKQVINALKKQHQMTTTAIKQLLVDCDEYSKSIKTEEKTEQLTRMLVDNSM
ncbi:MAG: GTP-binding protein [Methylomarinum sp.]|nr:GTP-binding protein [Methylomarinum sp.]